MVDQPQKPRVALFVTCLANVFRPAVAEAAVELLELAGCEVVVPLEQTCCGQPAYNGGDIPAALPLARRCIEAFENEDYVVVPSGSCAGMLVQHYPRLFEREPLWRERAEKLAARTYEINCFLADVLHWTPPAALASGCRAVTYHDSCAGLRELGIKEQPRRLLQARRALQPREMPQTEVCCGFGGTFCVKLPHISVAMADEKLDQALATGADTVLGGDLGCLLHLAGRARYRGLALDFRHVLEVLAGYDESLPPIGSEPR